MTAKTAPAKHPKEVVQDALQTTFVLKGTLKRVQLMYLQVGTLLVKVRNLKLYEALNHPDMETYARERLGLGRSSLYNYLRIHDWVSRSHPEWLKPKPAGFIPDLSDVGDLIWIESELAKPRLTASRRALLEKLREQGLAGKLRRSDIRKLRESENTVQGGLKKIVSQLKRVRRRATDLASVSPEVLAHIDAAIQMLMNDDALKVARLESIPSSKNNKWRIFSVA